MPVDPRYLHRRNCLAWLAAFSAGSSVFAQSSASSDPSPIVFGMVPYLPVQQLVRLYEPVVNLFERTLSKPSRLASAPDFEQFIERARRGEFDLVGASPHVARILHREAGFLPLVRATAPLEPLLIVPLDSPIKRLQDLQQQAVLMADPFAVHALIALREMRDQGLVPGRDFKLLVAGTQRNAVQRMLKGDAAAAVGSASTLGILPAELSGRFRVLLRAPKGLTPMAYMAHPRLRPQLGRLKQALLAFPATPEGQAMLKAAQHDGLVTLTDAELASVDPLVVEFYKQRGAA
ncbi:phosphate/phosphite/phosphonate ABC transporter substrate-binding protein [Roseateles albus]|uniref:Phosphate/phosphite/phosphonate ABC transporter substrate-binding protein n=1 Tax=Roseateles albus TaxID=2987525 RepID=A0ABT5KE21_9BURK|nr:phosphate/phosphite/phosphonate ABC transporter substrate-binding protein [Roseateles albus]MDC8772177.1 phosphate/phosphite/phosphonate ABC transporter substrate-binding protein [Roseateles albus]